MSIDKIKALSEDDTSKLEGETEFEAWVGDGYVKQRVTYERHNRHGYRIDTLGNTVANHVKGVPDDTGLTPFEKGLFTPTDCMQSVDSPENILDTGDATKAYYALDFARISGEKKLLACNYTTGCEVDVLDLATLSLESENDLSSGLDTTGTQDWFPLDVCNDGTYCYVLFQDTDASPETWCVQSYKLADFTVNTSWPATGLDLTGTGTFTLSDGQPKIIYAATDKLAVLQSWNTISSGTSAAVGIIDATDGTLDGEGAGGVTLTSTTDARGLCSNGTHVFFGVRDTSGNNVQIVSMPIASPGGSGMYSTLTGTDDIDDGSVYLGGLCCAGNTIVMTFKDDTSNVRAVSFVTNGTSIYINTSLITTGSTDVDNLWNVVFDGMDFWAHGEEDIATGETARMVRLDFVNQGSCDGADNAPYRPADSTLGTSFFSMSPDPITGGAPVGISYPMVHDGRDIWLGHTAGVVIRFSKTMLRK